MMNSCDIRSYYAAIDPDEYFRRFRDPERFAGFCRECGRYAKCWSCPPFEYDTQVCPDGYRQVWIVGTRIAPHRDLRARTRSREDVVRAERELLRQVRARVDGALLAMEARHPGSRAFFAGTCMWCPEGACTRGEGRACRFPEKMRPSLEAFGWDMVRTSAELLGVEMKWSRDGEWPEYFTLVSGFFTGSQIDRREWEEVFG